MPFAPDVQQRVIQAIEAKLSEKTPPYLVCAVCGQRNWTLADAQLILRLGDGKILPSVALVCTTCGNTLIINLVILGLGDIAGVLSANAV